MKRTVWLAVLLLAGAVGAGEAKWFENDLEGAKAEALKEGKDILIDFTGSDWCVYCKKLKSEVFDGDTFKREAPKTFVLLEMDYPKEKPQSGEIKKKNKEIARLFSIDSFPSVFLANSKGQVYGRTGYFPGGDAPYLERLGKLQAQKNEIAGMIESAGKSSGSEKAVKLDELLESLNKANMLIGYDDTMQEIIKADTEDKKGLKSKYEAFHLVDVLNDKMSANDPEGALAAIENHLKTHTLAPETKQNVFHMKAMILRAKGDEVAMLAALKTAHDAAPDSENGKAIAGQIEELEKKKK